MPKPHTSSHFPSALPPAVLQAEGGGNGRRVAFDSDDDDDSDWEASASDGSDDDEGKDRWVMRGCEYKVSSLVGKCGILLENVGCVRRLEFRCGDV